MYLCSESEVIRCIPISVSALSNDALVAFWRICATDTLIGDPYY